MKKIITIFITFLMFFCLSACKQDDALENNKGATAVKITGKAQVQLGGADLQLKVTIVPSTVSTTITWESNNPSIATVDQNGLVHGVSLGIVKITVITDNGLTATKTIKVTDEVIVEYPDLQGYTIRIAHSVLSEYDPFYEKDGKTYSKLDINEAQASLSAIEEDYNCHVSFVSYPSDAAWGNTRWDYIINQAMNNRTEFDVCVVTDSYIPRMVSGGALYSMSAWYDKYGNDFMDKAYIKSGTYKGQLYSLAVDNSSVYNILGVNLGLLEKVQEFDSSIEEPAQMFLDDNWSFDSFYEWCKKVQNVLNSKFSNEESKYYTLSGFATYYWQGMVNASGITVADTAAYKVNILGDVETEAANLILKLKSEGIADPNNQVDEYVQSWNNGQSVINTGEFWFLNSSARWKSDLWGEGEATRYGYVPYPSKLGTKSDYKLGVFGGQTWVMPVGKSYAGYGDECNAENIYRALVDYIQRKDAAYKGNDSYDEELAQTTANSKAFSSTASVNAISYLNINSLKINFFDPMSYQGNSVANLYSSDFASAANSYFAGNIATWAEAVAPYEETMAKTVLTIYG